jgi:vacuolar-type H+-ATPase subunit H
MDTTQLIEFLIDPLVVGVIVLGSLGSGYLWKEWKKNRQNGRDLLSYIPNVWTSFGILGTFIAIVLSLSKIDGVNINIIDLVKKIIPAFTTSIIGIFFAIFFSIWIKIVFAKEDKDDEENPNTPEQTLKRIEKALKDNINTTQDQTKRITDTLMNQSKILKDFVDDFVKNMDSIFKNMRDSIEKQTEAFGEEQYKKTSEITKALLSQFVQIQTDLINNLTEHSKTLLENNNAQFEKVSKDLNDKVLNMKKDMSDKITELSTDVAGRFSSLLGGLKGTCDEFQKSIGQFSENLKDNYGFIDKKAAQIVANYEQSRPLHTKMLFNMLMILMAR